MEPFNVRAKFLKGGELQKALLCNWNSRIDIKDFAVEADEWLRRGPGHIVETEAVEVVPLIITPFPTGSQLT